MLNSITSRIPFYTVVYRLALPPAHSSSNWPSWKSAAGAWRPVCGRWRPTPLSTKVQACNEMVYKRSNTLLDVPAIIQ